ncbi:anaerobic sulfatase maturase [Vibrio sp. HA2012]|uniref:anaerobic sulfatase maturase n=1 Tax=Vibrio sp. HA2012 TaxID=1971595 RepID=UPI000C2BAC9A|nr:anaerobic sulfatase maturase [Vibrio sp. HA2012]PJC86694.1 anaerobic sulfatase maturase [Vibrio sp. HA2012]
MSITVSGCHVMAKPSGSICNIDCKYCFYLEKEKLYPERNLNWRMDERTLEAYIQQHIDAQEGNEVIFAWQGGEPTLLGIEFYQRVIQYCGQYAQEKTIHHAFQTNGILIDERWCEFFKQNNFLVGLSIDGPQELHDYYRVTRSKKGTHEQVMRAVHLFHLYDISFNTLTVVNDKNVHEPIKVYEFLKEIGSTYIQFIPLVERKINAGEHLAGPNEPFASVTSWSVNANDFGQFLSVIFDYWIRKDVGSVFVQLFDSVFGSWLGHSAGLCVFSRTCGHAFALEANGDLYQCDHYVYPEFKLGNIHEMTIKEMNKSKEAIQFGLNKQNLLDTDCKRCRFLFACNGGCPKHRFEISFSSYPNHNYLCRGYYHFFSHIEPYMGVMVQLIKHGRPPADIMKFVR